MNTRDVAVAATLVVVLWAADGRAQGGKESFQLMETTIDDIHVAFKSGRLTARQLVQGYLDRIIAYDKQGPNINSIITLNDAPRLRPARRCPTGPRASSARRSSQGVYDTRTC